ncbi:MAG: metallophosphoesterase family protein [Planctomycetota bacterium]
MGRHLAIGDMHGCYAALRTLCDFVGLRSDDTIITLGDYCDRGPDTRAVLDWLIRRKTQCQLHPLRGNHDLVMVKARDDDAERARWLEYGGEATLRSYAKSEGDPGSINDVPDLHWEFLSNELMPYFETEKHFFVHANAFPEVPLEEQPDFMLYWERCYDPPRHMSGKIMVCGHTSQKSGLPFTNGNAICIDTWVYGAGWLTCLDVDSGMIWQANQRTETRQLWLYEIPNGTQD